MATRRTLSFRLGRSFGMGLFVNTCAARISIGIEAQRGWQLWAGAAQPHQPRNAPGHHHEQRERALDLFQAGQLQRLDPATVLQDVEQHLDLPACPIPLNQFNDLG